MKKLVSALLSICLLLTMCTCVMAEEEEILTVEFYGGFDNMKDWFADYLLKEKNLVVNGIERSDERTMAMMASGELSDIMYMTKENALILAEAGKLLNLDEYRDQLPNLFKYMNPAEEKWLRDKFTPEGMEGLYTCPRNFCYGSNKRDQNMEFRIRWDYYKEMGYPEVHTLDDLKQLLIDMHELHPTNAEGKKTYALKLFGDWGTGLWLDIICCNFGYANYENDGHLPYLLNLKTQEVESLFAEDSFFKTAMKFYFDLNQAGLMDPDYPAQAYSAAGANARAGVYLMLGDGGNHTQLDGNPDEGWRPIFLDDQYILGNPNLNHTSEAIVISKDAKNLEGALAFMDALNDPKTQVVIGSGPEGEMWEFVDGIPAPTEAYFQYLKDKAEGKTTIMSNGFEFNGNYNVSYPCANEGNNAYGIPPQIDYWPAVYAAQQANYLDTDWLEFYGFDGKGYPDYKQALTRENIFNDRCFVANYFDEMDTDMKLVNASIVDIINTTIVRMVYAADEAEFDAIYEKAKSDCFELGYEELLDWYEEQVEKGFEEMAKYVPAE